MVLKVILTILGLVIGFLSGLGILNILLKDKTREELKTDKSLQRKYGLIGWVVAVLGAYAGWLLADYF